MKYYAENKEKLKEKTHTTYLCSCGSESTNTHKVRHEKSKKHQAWLKDQEQTGETI